MTQRWAHVKRAAGLTLEQHIIAAQVDLGRFAGGAQLFQMAVTKFAFLVFLVAHSLRVGDPLGHRRSCGRGRNLLRLLRKELS